MVQDDYGVPTSLPWGMRFPQGLPPSTAQNLQQQFGVPIPEGVSAFEVLQVHPTQLYEVAIMLVAFFVLWRLRFHTKGTGWLMGLYLAIAGVERFGIEILRAKDDRIFGAFTIAQMASIGLVLVGMATMAKLWKAARVDIPAGAAVLYERT